MTQVSLSRSPFDLPLFLSNSQSHLALTRLASTPLLRRLHRCRLFCIGNSSGWWMVLMETPADENSQNLTTAANEAVHEQDNTVPAAINHGSRKLSRDFEGFKKTMVEMNEDDTSSDVSVTSVKTAVDIFLTEVPAKNDGIQNSTASSFCLNTLLCDRRGSEPEPEPEAEPEFAEEEVKGILEVIASTGKFWHAWYKLKSMLSLQLKQVLLEYPESKMTSEQQNASLGETYPELVKRLDEALVSFVEGPPFTLQRLCEILLEARSVYPNISKLALALEKNLLVTTMLTISTDPYPQATMQKTVEPEKAREEPEAQPNSAENGLEPVAGDRDEVMTDVEEADIDDEMTIDMEAFEEIVGSAETKAEPTANS